MRPMYMCYGALDLLESPRNSLKREEMRGVRIRDRRDAITTLHPIQYLHLHPWNIAKKLSNSHEFCYVHQLCGLYGPWVKNSCTKL
jgi:hypothetical protein